MSSAEELEKAKYYLCDPTGKDDNRNQYLIITVVSPNLPSLKEKVLSESIV